MTLFSGRETDLSANSAQLSWLRHQQS